MHFAQNNLIFFYQKPDADCAKCIENFGDLCYNIGNIYMKRLPFSNFLKLYVFEKIGRLRKNIYGLNRTVVLTIKFSK